MSRITKFIASVLLAVTFSASSHAQEVTQLTEDNVRAFIEKTTQITSGKETEMTQKQIDIYLDVHLHSDASFKSLMRYAIPGFEVQEKILSVNKEDFMKGIHEASDTVSSYQSQIIIDEINISKDGKNAVVKTRTLESGMMPVVDEIEKEEIPMEGVSSCTQVIMLSKKNVIQMFNANCVTEVHFNQFAP
jgi:hypothetical protein